MDVRDMDKVNKRINMHLVGYGTQFTSGNFPVATKGPRISPSFQIPFLEPNLSLI